MKERLLRIGLLLAATAIILIILPRADHQSYSYELNQPWKYPLLTAEFDLPILRDSTSARKMRDSIDANFIPFVRIDRDVAKSTVARFKEGVKGQIPDRQRNELANLLAGVYARGVLDPNVYEIVSKQKDHSLRVMELPGASDQPAVRVVDASGMLSPAKAFAYIDSVYSSSTGSDPGRLPAAVAKALNHSLVADITLDKAADEKFRSQEYLDVNGATGVIKKGQRIVDRGEIIDAQIFTNLNTYQEILERNAQNYTIHTYYYIGQAIYILLCFLSLYLFLYLYRKAFYMSLRKMTFLVCFITLFMVFSSVMFEYVTNGMMLVPFAAVPVIVMVFFDDRTAIYSLLVTVLLASLLATFQLQFIFMEMMAGLFATFSIRQLSKRSQLLNTAWITFVSYVVSFVALGLLTYGNLSDFSWRIVMYFGINAVILSFAYVLIFIVERVFGFTSTVTLVELSDINSPLLRRLAEEAPGTFQHSMQVSTLAAEGARAIDANTQLVRTGALYHDIGKLESPIFFTENQHGVNPHSGLNPETSAQKIISHVKDGVALAKEARLPEVIRDFITEHHGKGITRYFYNTAVNESGGKPVDITRFQYPGPNPRSKETAILMMADSVEAASRSLKDYSRQSIDALVDKIVDSQVEDGLFKDSPISFRDVEIVKDTFKKRLATIYHSRIVYPEIKKTVTAGDSKQEPGDSKQEPDS